MAAARGEGSPERSEQGQVRRDTVDAARTSGVGECVPVSSWRGAHSPVVLQALSTVDAGAALHWSAMAELEAPTASTAPVVVKAVYLFAGCVRRSPRQAPPLRSLLSASIDLCSAATAASDSLARNSPISAREYAAHRRQ